MAIRNLLRIVSSSYPSTSDVLNFTRTVQPEPSTAPSCVGQSYWNTVVGAEQFTFRSNVVKCPSSSERSRFVEEDNSRNFTRSWAVCDVGMF